MFQKICVWGSLFLLPLLVFSQEYPMPFGMAPDGVMPCATSEHMHMFRQQQPSYQSDADFENWLSLKMEEASRRGDANSRMVLTIPVVFHIIHDGEPVGTGFNIPAANVYSQIDILNEDFRRKVGTAGFNNHPAGADVEIEFCAAFWGPDNRPLAEPGINRVDRNAEGWPEPFKFQFSTMEDTIKPVTSWNPDQYFNIWVSQISFNRPGSLLLGYAQFPSGNVVSGLPFSGAADTDGVVILYTTCGRVNRAANNSDQGRTLTHEVGHWLSLRHTWGDGPCGRDDFCSDTPESDSANFSCSVGHISCGSLDMIENYMDYSVGTCKNIFTECQKTRMRTVLLNAPRRASLLQSRVCDRPTTAPIADFAVNGQGDCDREVSFSDSSSNLPTNWFWAFGDGNSSTQRSPSHTYATAGTYTVRLVVNNSFGNSLRTQIIQVGLSDVDAGLNQQIQIGDSIQLSATTSKTAQSWQWSPLQGFRNPTDAMLSNPWVKPSQTVTYQVLMFDTDGCEARDSVTIEVDETSLSLSQGEFDGRIYLPYPNPAYAEVTFSADLNVAGELSLAIYDLQGKKIQHVVNDKVGAGKFKYTWRRENKIAMGLYFIHWTFGGRTIVQKIQLQ